MRILTLLAAASACWAVPVVSLHSSNLGLGSMSYSVDGTTITITEEWSSPDAGSLEISGLDLGINYLVIMQITNATGVSWSGISFELLDPDGQGNDAFDPFPYPDFVPAGFTTSNPDDGLSFAEGSGIPRKSSAFKSVIADGTDDRDLLNFISGTAPASSTFTVQFGLRNQATKTNEPLLLWQQPNVGTGGEVPEPATLTLVGLGVLSAIVRRVLG